MDQALFLETLKAIVTVAKTENNYLTKEQIKKYMKDSGVILEEDKFSSIYQYLGENGVVVEGYDFKPVQKQTEETEEVEQTEETEENQEEEITEEDSIYLKMYLLDLKEISELSEDEKTILWKEMKNENTAASKRLMEGYLHEVVKAANQYRNRGTNLEDLIQEGNVALLQVFEEIKNMESMEMVNAYLKDSIEEAMKNLIDIGSNDFDWENTVLAKVNLIHEAARYLAKELGRAATIKELADYTKMSEEEIEDAVRLSSDIL